MYSVSWFLLLISLCSSFGVAGSTDQDPAACSPNAGAADSCAVQGLESSGHEEVVLAQLVSKLSLRQGRRSDNAGHVAMALSANSERSAACGVASMTFEEFVQQNSRSYVEGSQEYQARKSLFYERAAEASAHNCREDGSLWRAGITPLADWTPSELQRLRGRRGPVSQPHAPSGGGPSAHRRLAALETSGTEMPALPQEFNWGNLRSMNEIFDQGACGSCWASATGVMLRAHTDIYTQHQDLSIQQLVSCVPNPQGCGGSGGCNGSTGELALDYVYHNGLVNTKEFPYQDKDKTCPSIMRARDANPVPQPNASSLLQLQHLPATQYAEAASPAMRFGMVGWSRLPVNNLQALYSALYREGPVAVSVVAGYSWNAYVSGIMNNCSKQDQVVNHLVVLIGYGTDSHAGAKYWHIQNSWGPKWGEHGQVRMIRQDDPVEEKETCAWDNKPAIGTGCKGGPPKVWVCGSCGILYDNVVAHFHGSSPQAQEMLKRRGEAM